MTNSSLSLPPSLRAADTIDRCLLQILKYIEGVQAGKVPSNPRVLKIDSTRFEAMLNSTMQVLACVQSLVSHFIHSHTLYLVLYSKKGVGEKFAKHFV